MLIHFLFITSSICSSDLYMYISGSLHYREEQPVYYGYLCRLDIAGCRSQETTRGRGIGKVGRQLSTSSPSMGYV